MRYVTVMEKRIVREMYSRTLEENRIMDNVVGVRIKPYSKIQPKVRVIHGTPNTKIEGTPVIPKEDIISFTNEHGTLDRGTTLAFYEVPKHISIFKEGNVYFIKETLIIDEKGTKVSVV